MKTITLFIAITIIACSFYSCKKSTTSPTIVKQWMAVAISAKFETPAPAGRSEAGTVDVKLYSDNTLTYSATINNLTAGDAIVAGHIHFGDAVTSGPVILPLNPTFTTSGSASTASGTVTVSSTLADTLQNRPIYINFHSTAAPGGLVRGQMDKVIDFATDVTLSGANEVPAVVTTATGKALLRLTSDKILYSKVTVTGLEPNDAILVSHLHSGVAGVSGPVIQLLTTNAGEFGISITHSPTDAVISALKNDPVYVNAHSSAHGSGVLRGQIR